MKMKRSKELCKLDDDMWEAHSDYARENDRDWANADELREEGLAIGEDAYKLNPENDYETEVGDWEFQIETAMEKFYQPHQFSVVSAAAYYRCKELQEEAAYKADQSLAVAADIAGVV